jgi:hypothetical protein
MFKAINPKMALTRNMMGENLKLKAEELVQRRVDRERRKHTEDFQLEKLVVNKDNLSEESETEMTISQAPNNVRILRGHHKESVARPLTEDSEDESPIGKRKTPLGKNRSPNKYYYNNFRVSENVSRLMDDKRSTIKEQVEDEEEFTGSSLNVSTNLNFIRASKQCKHKRESETSKNSPYKDSEPMSKNSKRKNSDNLMGEPASPMNILEGSHSRKRIFTDNMYECKPLKGKEEAKGHNDENSTTIEGTSVITPFMYSRKDSGFEAYAASMISTPSALNPKANREGPLRDTKKGVPSLSTTQMSIFKSTTGKEESSTPLENPFHNLSKDNLHEKGNEES